MLLSNPCTHLAYEAEISRYTESWEWKPATCRVLVVLSRSLFVRLDIWLQSDAHCHVFSPPRPSMEHDIYKLRAFRDVLFRSGLPNLVNLAATAVVGLAVVYFQKWRIELPVSFCLLGRLGATVRENTQQTPIWHKAQSLLYSLTQR